MRNNRRLVLAWIIALGFVAFGVLADLYFVYVWGAQPVAAKETSNPYQQLYEDLLYPSVRIVTDDGIGSGVIIHRKGPSVTLRVNSEDAENTIYILTAAHVVGDEALVTVELFNSTESLPAFVVATDTDKDLALLKICNLESAICNYRAAKLAPRDYVPYIFTPVWVIGCSLGYPPRPTAGEITRADTEKPKNGETKKPVPSSFGSSVFPSYWEMNAPIWPGNSGGGVFLKDTHELIGIAVWVKVCHGQLASTMGGIVPLYEIYDFLEGIKDIEEIKDTEKIKGNQSLNNLDILNNLNPLNLLYQIYDFIDRLAVDGERLAVPDTEDRQSNTENQTPQDLERGGD